MFLEIYNQAGTGDVMVVVGSSFVVSPANSLLLYAKNTSATLIEVNPASTPFSDEMDFSIRKTAAEDLVLRHHVCRLIINDTPFLSGLNILAYIYNAGSKFESYVTSVAEGNTEVVYETSDVLNTVGQNARLKDTCMEYTRPSLALGIESIRKSFLDAKGRDVKLRYITEITTENISYCKELMKIADVKHLDGIKGNFMVNEKEYLAPAASNNTSNIASQIIYSNLHEIVEHQQYMFETLWSKAILAEQRIREIEEGVHPVSTRILEDQDLIIDEIRRLNYDSTRLSVCSGFGGMQMSYRHFFDSYLYLVDKQRKGEGEGMRWAIHIDKENLDLVKVFLKAGIEVRHIRSMPPMNFGNSERALAATIGKQEGGKVSQSFLFSTEPLYIDHFSSLFEEVWKDGTDANERIALIEEGADLADIEIIQNPRKGIERAWSYVEKSKYQVLSIFATPNAFRRQIDMGLLQLLKETTEQRHVQVRILIPGDKQIKDTIDQAAKVCPLVDFRVAEENMQTRINIILIDKKDCMIIESRDDTKDSSYHAAGLITYSNSKSIISSYVSIFESLWKQNELYEQLKFHDKMQIEFINIAAHELRTPIQPILSLTELLRTQIKDVKQQEILDITIRNAKRLQHLSYDILDAAKIEGRSLELNKEEFNLNEVVINTITDLTSGRDFLKHEKIKLIYNPRQDILIKADKGRISQVISNLLSNAIDFTAEGTILVSIEKDKINNNNETIIVSVKDPGQGIALSILPRLFTKFTSKSYKGTGLGLFISKGIIEAHGGKIWGENNSDGIGAKFSFILPAS